MKGLFEMGLFIDLEGLDGCGKTTQTELLCKRFEKENIKMSRCHVDTYSDSGSCSGCTFKNIKDLEQLKSFPSPYMTFYVDFANTLNDQYQYSMECSTNDNRCFVYVDLRKKND